MSGFSLSARFPNASKAVLAANAKLLLPAKATPATPAQPAKKSPLAVKFEQMWEVMAGPAYVTEYQFDPDRLFRLDYFWPDERVGLELQGGIYLAGKGGHVSPKGVRSDCEKLNLATAHGIRVLKLATGQITPDLLQQVKDIILALRTASSAWQQESARLFALARQTGHARHAEAAQKAIS